MKSFLRWACIRIVPCIAGVLACCATGGRAQEIPVFNQISRQTNRDVAMILAATSGRYIRIETAESLADWRALATLRSVGANSFTDSGTQSAETRFYRAVVLEGTNHFTGDHIATADGDVVVQPVNHASFVMQWKGITIYNDPVGDVGLYRAFPRPDVILVSHTHGDHFNSGTLGGIRTTNSFIVGPAAVVAGLSTSLRSQAISLANGGVTNLLGFTVEAVPAYNANHPKGVGNGYVVTMGGRRFYMSGDTGNTVEMRALANIDVAFLCMNIPFTMNVAEAVNALRAFQPRLVYPYHYRNSDGTFASLITLRNQVSQDLPIEVRSRKWY